MMTRRSFSGLSVLFLLTAVGSLFSCAETGSGDSGVPATGFFTDETEMYQRSLIRTGNNFRVRQVIDKARSGEDVTIAFIGGSITQGYGPTPEQAYVNGSIEAFKLLFGTGDNSHIHYVNAGMGGTPSSIGAIRYTRDVIEGYGQTAPPEFAPDMVVIEFAVNDADDMTDGAAFESLVRDVLEADNAPAVLLLFSVFEANLWNLQERFIPIGEAYDLPMVSIKDAIEPAIDDGSLDPDLFFRDDGLHPDPFGFQLMADCLTGYFTTVDAEAADTADLVIPETPVISSRFQGLQLIDSNTIPSGVVINSTGSFTGTDVAVSTFTSKAINAPKTFPDNWYKNSGAANDSFSMTLTCKNLLMVFKLTTSTGFGTVEVSVDGTPAGIFNPVRAGAWNNAWAEILIDEDTAEEHTVTIRMTDADEADYFTILGFGYSD
jgi:lysophospholipase L1-like esterase